MPEDDKYSYDVFLSHNSKDKSLVRELKRKLAEKGIKVWVDEDELRPGIPWQHFIEAVILASRSVAVIVGNDGLGPWEKEEMRVALSQAVKEKVPVIPVVLSGLAEPPKLPPFLANRTWVMLDAELSEATIDRLIWGITGTKPSRQQWGTDLRQGRHFAPWHVQCKLNCIGKENDVLHQRPSAFLNKLCRQFPETDFYLRKDEDGLERRINMKSQIEMVRAEFQHEQMVILEVSGKTEITAAMFLKIALENLNGFADEPDVVRSRIGTLIDELGSRLYDPDIDDDEMATIRAAREHLNATEKEYRILAVTNDRLHEITLLMIPLIAKHFKCSLDIRFEIAETGIHMARMTPSNDYTFANSIMFLDIQVGTRLTIVTSGKRNVEAALALKNVIQNLWQCDRWLRARGDLETEASVSALLDFAGEMARHYDSSYAHVQSPLISNLLRKSVIVNTTGQSFSKTAALEQLATPHVLAYGLQMEKVLKEIEEGEGKQTVILRQGFAIAHAKMEKNPRIAISFAIYPDGVQWSRHDGTVKLVAMILYASDAVNTWPDYRRRLAFVFRSVPDLFEKLLLSRSDVDFVSIMRKTEYSLANI